MIRALAMPGAAAALMLLTGAGQATDGFSVTDASAAQVAAAYAKARPGGLMHMGQWERAIEITAIDLPGMPAGPERDALIAKIKAKKETESVCQNGTDLAGPEPAEIFEMLGAECRYQHLRMGGGSFDGQLSCTGDEPGSTVDVAVSGTYSSEAFAITLKADLQPADPVNRIAMTMQLNGHRTGECAK